MTSTRQHHANALASELAAADGDNNAGALELALERGHGDRDLDERKRGVIQLCEAIGWDGEAA